jgi:DEAD/DEAH box helicase domain-containing protein
MDDLAIGNTPAWKQAWREFLRLDNAIQFLPESAWMTSTGLAEGIYGSLLEHGPTEPSRPSNAVLELLLADVLDAAARQIVIAADAAGIALPEAGFEITDGDGEIVAVAELAWPSAKACVLTESQDEYAQAALAAGWTVWKASEVVAAPDSLFVNLPKRKT